MPQADFASFTREISSQIALGGRAAMFDGDDVLRLIPQTGIVLVQLAITESRIPLPLYRPTSPGT